MKAARRLNQIYFLDEKGNIIVLRESPYRFPKSFFDKRLKNQKNKSFVRLELNNNKKSSHE